MKSNAEPLPTWKSFVVELLIYSALIIAYFYFALHYLGGWLKELFDTDRNFYAIMSLLVMIGQAVGLQIICSFLLWALRAPKKKK